MLVLNTKKRRAPTPEQKLNQVLKRYQFQTVFPLLAAAIVSFVTTYNGVKLITDWLAKEQGNTEMVALMVSFVAAGVSFGGWMMTINLLRLYLTGRARLIGAVVLIYLLSITAMASTYTSFIGLTQASARAMYLMDMATSYASYARALRMRAAEMENAYDFIVPQAQDACVKSDTEIRTGTISGSRGTGPVASNLQSLCTRKTVMAENIERTLAELTPLVADIRMASRRIDALVLDTGLSLSEREVAFIRQARVLEGMLEDLRATDRMRAVRAGYEDIGEAVNGLNALTQNVSQGQANALLGIIASERSSAKTMANMLDQIDAQSVPEAVRAELIPAPRIALRYASDHIPQFALALCLDAFGPVCALLFFAGSLRKSRHLNKPKGA